MGLLHGIISPCCTAKKKARSPSQRGSAISSSGADYMSLLTPPQEITTDRHACVLSIKRRLSPHCCCCCCFQQGLAGCSYGDQSFLLTFMQLFLFLNKHFINSLDQWVKANLSHLQEDRVSILSFGFLPCWILVYIQYINSFVIFCLSVSTKKYHDPQTRWNHRLNNTDSCSVLKENPSQHLNRHTESGFHDLRGLEEDTVLL